LEDVTISSSSRLKSFSPVAGIMIELRLRILLERQEKRLAFNLNLLGFKRIFLNEWARRRLRIGLVIWLPVERRGPFV